jgi:hypothetical protein
MKTLAAQAEKLRSRLAAGLHSKYGFTSETLLKFGVKLRKVPRRKTCGETGAPAGSGAFPGAADSGHHEIVVA